MIVAHNFLLVLLTAMLLYSSLVCILESFINAHTILQMRINNLRPKVLDRRRDLARRSGDFVRAVLFIIIAVELWI